VLKKLKDCKKQYNAYKITTPRSMAKSPLQKAVAKRSTIATIFGALNQAGNNGTARVQMRAALGGTNFSKAHTALFHCASHYREITKSSELFTAPRESLVLIIAT
jgi:hypothetical protein